MCKKLSAFTNNSSQNQQQINHKRAFINHFGFAEPPWDRLSAFGQELVWEDSHLQETQGGRYRKNEPFAVADIYDAGHSRCHIEVLEQFQIRAYAIAPIFIGAKLWGMLAAYQHSTPRQWHHNEVEFLVQAASHLGVAMQQAENLEQTKQRTAELQDAIARQRTLTEVVGNIRSSVNTEFILNTACQANLFQQSSLLGQTREEANQLAQALVVRSYIAER